MPIVANRANLLLILPPTGPSKGNQINQIIQMAAVCGLPGRATTVNRNLNADIRLTRIIGDERNHVVQFHAGPPDAQVYSR